MPQGSRTAGGFALGTTHRAWNAPVVELQAGLRQAPGISHGVSISVCCSERTVGSWIAGILGTIFFIVEFKIDKAQL